MRKDDIEHNSVVNDYELERGEHPIGKLVHISTITHAFRGYLIEVTPSYYILDGNKEWSLVETTGPINQYAKNPINATDGDTYKPNKNNNAHIRCLRTAVSWIMVCI